METGNNVVLGHPIVTNLLNAKEIDEPLGPMSGELVAPIPRREIVIEELLKPDKDTSLPEEFVMHTARQSGHDVAQDGARSSNDAAAAAAADAQVEILRRLRDLKWEQRVADFKESTEIKERWKSQSWRTRLS